MKKKSVVGPNPQEIHAQKNYGKVSQELIDQLTKLQVGYQDLDYTIITNPDVFEMSTPFPTQKETDNGEDPKQKKRVKAIKSTFKVERKC
jgi:hypothetical protein